MFCRVASSLTLLTLNLVVFELVSAYGTVGLSPIGVKRSECLRRAFGAQSQFKIDHIMAQKPKKGEFLGTISAFKSGLC